MRLFTSAVLRRSIVHALLVGLCSLSLASGLLTSAGAPALAVVPKPLCNALPGPC
jgi:hypothetical protein